MKTKLWIGLLAASALTFNAQAITLELGLVIDGSGSISPAEFTLQKTGYVNALNAVLPIDGSVAVGVWQFSTGVSPVFATTIINNPASRLALTTAISGMGQLGGTTAIGLGIAAAATEILANAITSDRQVIDVSTDGENNVPPDPVIARNAALLAGIDQINGLGIGAGANLSFVGGTGSFGITVPNFAAFEGALITKLNREIRGTPDAGNTLILMSLGLLGLAAFRRKRAA